MGKGTDKLYITHSEWSSADAYSASVGSNAGARAQNRGASFRKLPFNFCAASLQPFKNPVCTPDGTIFDVEVIGTWLEKHDTNPVNGEPLSAKDLIRLNFARNADTEGDRDRDRNRNTGPSDGKGELVDPVTFKVFTDNTHIVAVRHGTYANVFAWETVERMNIKPKMWRDLVDDEEFGRRDIITLQDPQNAASRDLSKFKYLKDGEDAILTKEQEEERRAGNVNIDALGRVGEKVLRAKEAVERARRERQAAGGDVNRSANSKSLSKIGSSAINSPHHSPIQERKLAHNAASYTTGRAAASFTSTGLTPETTGERAVLSDEEWMLKPRRVKIKGYARMDTTLGNLTIELQTETAPKAVWNFIRLAQKGYYRDVAFHRNIKNFMIQGGDPSGTGRGGTSIWGRNFTDEFEGPLTHDGRGVMSMANKGKNTNSSQFFITYREAKHLDNKHTIFGRVVGGLDDVLTKMERQPTDEANRPLEPIVIKDVVVLIDPFEEFLKEKSKRDLDEKRKAEDGGGGGGESGGGSGSASTVGKYLKAATQQQQQQQQRSRGGAGEDEEVDAGKQDGGETIDTWEEPVRKKVKTGGLAILMAGRRKEKV
ncbi:peptidyl-prolyl cis-trans isomerase-like 2 [Bombardia bombarda]|uniref:Peptidyl-prolyl cis-trans isomerase-like 2 n=1 Tax=Bombardia bombarda TaxID=252184 RepID=A0AA40CGN9_9PEZI|nr:peptidyl-prolyl cis-trans isomerase-like 2 [Bombardia bombarda]